MNRIITYRHIGSPSTSMINRTNAWIKLIQSFSSKSSPQVKLVKEGHHKNDKSIKKLTQYRGATQPYLILNHITNDQIEEELINNYNLFMKFSNRLNDFEIKEQQDNHFNALSSEQIELFMGHVLSNYNKTKSCQLLTYCILTLPNDCKLSVSSSEQIMKIFKYESLEVRYHLL